MRLHEAMEIRHGLRDFGELQFAPPPPLCSQQLTTWIIVPPAL